MDRASKALAEAPANDNRTWVARADSSGVALTGAAPSFYIAKPNRRYLAFSRCPGWRTLQARNACVFGNPSSRNDAAR